MNKKNNFSNTDNFSWEIQIFDKYYIKIYNHHILDVQATNFNLIIHNYMHVFNAVNFHNYNLILNYS